MPKTTRRAVLNSQSRELVLRLRDYFERESQNDGPLLPLACVVDRVAAALDISRDTVMKISKEKHGTVPA